MKRLAVGAISILLALSSSALADGPLDGRAYTGMIGPVENPDLSDSLFFDDGHFWSDICTRCGFQPGAYLAEETADGIVFRGVLESDSRGSFAYEGLVRENGEIDVSIKWERKRWYWTSRREIAFRGSATAEPEPVSLEAVLLEMGAIDPDASPLCARF